MKTFVKSIVNLTLLAFIHSNTNAQGPNITSSSATNNICTGATINLTGNYTFNYNQWQVYSGSNWVDIGGATTNSYAATSAGDYRLKTSTVLNFSTYTITNVITILNATSLSIDDNLPIDGQLPPINGYNISINTTNPPDYTSFRWYRNGVPMPTLYTTMAPINTPGDYLLITEGACGPERSNIEVIKYETFDPGWNSVSGQNINTMLSFTSPTIVNGDLIVQSGGVLSIAGSKLNVNGCYQIKVESGGILAIYDQSILSSSNQWKGILVEDGGKLSIYGKSFILDAVAGVITQGETETSIQNSTFGRNILHIGIDEITGDEEQLITYDTFGHIIDSATSIICNSFTEYNNLSAPRGTCIFATGGVNSGTHTLIIQENRSWMITEATNRWNTGFLLAEDIDSLEFVSNKIEGFYFYGTKISGGHNLNFLINHCTNLTPSRTSYGYTIPPVNPRFGHGHYFKDVSTALIMDNEIKYWVLGTQYYENLSSVATYYYDNRMRDCEFGLVVANVRNPINYTGTDNSSNYGNPIGLHLQCNLFKFNDYGMVGTGDLPNQGSSTLSAGNRFYEAGAGGWLNSESNFIWYFTSNSFNYYHSEFTTDDNPDMTNNGNITLDNNSKNGANSNYTEVYIGVGENSCTVTMSGPELNVQGLRNSELGVEIYPNPFDENIKINGISEISRLEVYDILGQLHYSVLLNEPNNSIYLGDLHPGIYLITISNSSSATTIKLVKS